MSLEQHTNYSWAISAPFPCSTSTEKASESHFSSLPNSRAECGKLLQKAPQRKRQHEAKPLTDPTCSHRSSKPPGATAEESRAPPHPLWERISLICSCIAPNLALGLLPASLLSATFQQLQHPRIHPGITHRARAEHPNSCCRDPTPQTRACTEPWAGLSLSGASQTPALGLSSELLLMEFVRSGFKHVLTSVTQWNPDTDVPSLISGGFISPRLPRSFPDSGCSPAGKH